MLTDGQTDGRRSDWYTISSPEPLSQVSLKHTGKEIWVLIILSSSKASGEPAQMRRLTRAFAAPIHEVWV